MKRLIGNLKKITPGRRKLSDDSGVAAIEFAILAPILILLFIGTLEISYAVAVDRKISRISSSVADLITQGDSYSEADLNKIMDIAKRIMQPYEDPANALKISLVAIEIDSGEAKVDWSHGFNGGDEPAQGSTFAVPANIKVDGTYLLSATVSVEHEPAFSFVGFREGYITFDDSSISLEEQMFLRPRLDGGGIQCSDC